MNHVSIWGTPFPAILNQKNSTGSAGGAKNSQNGGILVPPKTIHKHFLCLFAEYWVFSGPRVVVSLSLMGNILKTTFLFDGMVAYIKDSASSKCKVWNCKWFYNFALYISPLNALILRSQGWLVFCTKKGRAASNLGFGMLAFFGGKFPQISSVDT